MKVIKSKIEELIRLLLIVLFVYTATNKLITQIDFVSGLSRFPLLKPFADLLGIIIPILELGISILLIIPKWSCIGLKISLILMLMFTSYLGYTVFGGYELPCSCGGIISRLTWTQHLYFNIGIIGLIIYSLLNKEPKGN